MTGASYLVCGQANLHHSDIVQGDFVRYVDDIQMSYRLDCEGAVTGMEHYYMISEEARAAQLERLAKEKADRPKLKPGCKNAHTSKLKNEVIEKAKENIPDKLESSININDLWNKEFMDSLLPFSMEEEADESENPDFIFLEGKKIDLSKLSRTDRKEAISKWQSNLRKGEPDNEGPTGFIFGIQEMFIGPKSRRAGVLDRTGHNLMYDRTADKPRAAILASKNLSVFLDTDLTTPDCAIAKFLTGIPEMPEVYIASIYCDINEVDEDKIIPLNLIKCIRRCEKNNYGFLCYGDFNAHSHLWYSETDNTRGKIYERHLIAEYGLNVLNNNNIPTYYGANTTGTIVDVTLASSNMVKYCPNWINRYGAASSDHASLEHTLLLGTPLMIEPQFKFRSATEQDFQLFRAHLDSLLQEEFPETGSYDDFEKKQEFFHEKINEALEATIEKTKPRPLKMTGISRCQHWWDKKCTQLGKAIRRIRNYTRRRIKFPDRCGAKPKYTQEDLRKARKEYWDYLRKAQDKGWKNFVETREGSTQMGSFNRKILKQANLNAAIPLFKRAEGTEMTPDETVATILREHFPNCRDELDQAPFIEARRAKEKNAQFNTADKSLDFLTLEKVIASMNSFEPLKGSGSDRLPPIVFQWFGPNAYNWLHKSCKATYQMGLLPKQWLDVKVLFIP